MKKSTLLTGLLCLSIATSSVSANEKFDLRTNMMKLNVEMIELQRGLIEGSQKKVESVLENFEKDTNELLGNKGEDISEEYKNKMHREKMMAILPDDLENKKHKVSIAIENSRKIESGISFIREALENKDGLSMVKRQIKAQEAYLEIVNACFNCHNLVRDKNKI